MRTKPFRVLGLTLATVALVASCSSSGNAIEVPLEARWQCDVQRQTFDDMAAIELELDIRLAKAGLTRAEYNVFKENLSASADLRARVLEEYDAYCLS